MHGDLAPTLTADTRGQKTLLAFLSCTVSYPGFGHVAFRGETESGFPGGGRMRGAELRVEAGGAGSVSAPR